MRDAELIPFPVDLRALRDTEPGLWPIHYGPETPLGHPCHPGSVWNLYGRPEPAPWGSYLETKPMPLDRRVLRIVGSVYAECARLRGEVAA